MFVSLILAFPFLILAGEKRVVKDNEGGSIGFNSVEKIVYAHCTGVSSEFTFL